MYAGEFFDIFDLYLPLNPPHFNNLQRHHNRSIERTTAGRMRGNMYRYGALITEQYAHFELTR